jgi:hypothetical protein
MKAKKIIYNDVEGNFFSPRVILGKVISEDEIFINFLTGKGKSYRINKNHIISIEQTDVEFVLEKEAT